MVTGTDPIAGPPPAEVPLPKAPLVRVIAQIRFSPILAVQDPAFIAPFQKAIGSRYPVLTRAAGAGQMTWRFREMKGAWRVSLASDFIALETTRYVSWDDFHLHLEAVVDALEKHIEPTLVQRVGLRYIDRVEGLANADIVALVRSEMLGLIGTPLSDHVLYAVSEAILALPESQDQLCVRWGRIPPGGTVDPTAIEPIEVESWILDLDMFSSEEVAFSVGDILSSAKRYSQRLYAMFRWAVTDEFLRRYGGEA